MSAREVEIRSQRSDAVRNRMEIIRVAQTHFRERGMDASLDAIAREAGVGAGTLYRHFATRDDLIAAVLDVHDEAMVSRIAEIDEIADPGEALEAWQTALEGYFSGYRGFVGPFGQALDTKYSAIANACKWLISTSARLLQAAQTTGSARSDLRGEDVYLSVLTVAWASQAASAEAVDGMRRIIRRGIAGPRSRDASLDDHAQGC
ncbi:TetR/AcrR family transcriptional regulator [Curtobacterium pusillum]|uniref:TetR/AcrR family transcriptional regulator n=1 Tax=Curtobacterium pusillum TaxID=69373 RepID=UPI0011A22867|nr:helix-turn-helix domain-containing protein [Curtobacterium pusillum]